MNPAFHVFKMLGAALGSLVILSLVLRIGAPENRLYLFGAIGIIVLSATAIWVGIGHRAAISRRAPQMLAWVGMLVFFAVLQLRVSRRRSQMPDHQEILSEFLIPLTLIILAAVVAGSIAGGILRHKRQQNAPGPSGGSSSSLG